MKKTIHFHLALILFATIQQSTKVSAQNNLKWGISVAINSVEAQLGDPEWNSWGYAKSNFQNYGDIRNKSLSLSIIPKYFISNDVLLRFEFGITNIHLTNHYNSANLAPNNTPNVVSSNQNIEQKIYRYIPGIQWNFMRKKFLETYCGMTASYLHYSDMKYQNATELRTVANNTLIDGIKDNATATGGFAAGVGPLTGFNIYLGEHISLGAELSYSLLYYKIGNTFSGTTTSLVPNFTEQVYSYATSYEGFQFSKMLPSMNITIRF